MVRRHRKRPIRFLKLAELGGWRVKIYGITQHGERPDPVHVAKAIEIADERLPRPAVAHGRYGLGFAAVHQADEFLQIVLDWWERENELRHRVFKAGPEAPLDFREITASGEAFCVWELRVLAFEREAWLETVLERVGGPDFEDYLMHRLSEDA